MSKTLNTKFFACLTLLLMVFGVPGAWALFKNTASQSVCKTVLLTTGQPKTTGTVTIKYRLHPTGTFISVGAATHLESGVWCVAVGATETNADMVTYQYHPDSSTAIEFSDTYSMLGAQQTGDSFTHVNSSIYGMLVQHRNSTTTYVLLQDVDTEADSLVTNLALVPKSDGSVAFNSTAVTGIQSGLATSAEVAAVSTQVANIAVSGTAATAIASGQVLITGEEATLNPVNDYTRTYNANGVANLITSAQIGGTGRYIIDKWYKFNVGIDGTPVQLATTGFLHSHANIAGKVIDAYAWVYAAGAGGAWEKVTTNVFLGATTEVNQQGQAISLRTAHVCDANAYLGSDGNACADGDVWVRYYTTTNDVEVAAYLAIDQMIMSYSAYRMADYENGSIYVDTLLGVDSAVPGRDGLSYRPVNSYAHFETLEGLLGINRAEIGNRSALTLDGGTNDLVNHIMHGSNWTMVMQNSLNLSGATIIGAWISGSSVAPSATSIFDRCHFGDTTLSPCGAFECGIVGEVTVGAAGDFVFAGTHTHGDIATIDFGSAVGATSIRLPGFSGALLIKNMKAGDAFAVEGAGKLTFDSTNTGADAGSISCYGEFKIENASGKEIIHSDSVNDINDEIDTRHGSGPF